MIAIATEEKVKTLDIFEEMEKEGHEQVIFNYDKATGLKSIIAIHDTTLGPALGGCRMWPYESTEDALRDVLRLSKGMTYKNGISNLELGGGKSVIIGDSRTDKSDELFQAFGSFVELLKGRYYTATDVGTVGMDFVASNKQTEYVVGLPEEYGGSGNTAITTAYGVYRAMKATAKEVFGNDTLKGLRVAVQGLGKVGALLVDYLHEEGAHAIVTDIFQENIDRILEKYPDVEAVKPDEIIFVDCDILAPCALGGVINDDTIEQLRCSAICGSANNVLAEERHGDILHEKGIIYAPDYLANAGGVIQAADESHGYRKDRVWNKTGRIYEILGQIYQVSREQNIPTHRVANKLVDDKLRKVAGIQSKYMGK
jgi:leucine dehydrogenase